MTGAAEPVGIGVLGGRSMVATRAVMPAIDNTPGARLAAVCSLGGPVPEPWSHLATSSYDAVLAHPDVEAVYVPLPNGMHERWVTSAADAGRDVLCEKPLAPTVAEAERMETAAAEAGVLLAEAWMTPFDPRWAEALALARSGLIGDVDTIDAQFTFTIPDAAADNYRWRPDQGGGALLDVGVYCLGAAVELWGPEPIDVESEVVTAPSGVDATVAAALRWSGARRASIRCSFVEPETQRLEYVGDLGRLVLDGHAHTGGGSCIDHYDTDGVHHPITVDAADPYLRMIEHFAACVREGAEWPRPVERSIEMLALLDRIRETAR